MKVCPKCNKEKDVNKFTVNKFTKDGLYYCCKDCINKKSKKYSKTKIGVIIKIYSTQRSSSKNRQHLMPNYSLDEFKKWMYSQDKFDKLYLNWKLSWYNKMFKPSVDRLNDYKSYTMDNIQLVTWRENIEKHYFDRKNWINNKGSKAVIWINKITWKQIEFYSMKDAERKTGVDNAGIWRCCNWIYKSAWNYIWKLKS